MREKEGALLDVGTPGTPVFTKRCVFLSFSTSLSFLTHCHMGASRYNVPAARFDACPGWQYIWHMNIYGISLLASASTHDSRCAAINMRKSDLSSRATFGNNRARILIFVGRKRWDWKQNWKSRKVIVWSRLIAIIITVLCVC